MLPERNPIADDAIADLRRFGVDASKIVRGKGRMGTHYVEAGTNQRPSKVVYDHEHAAIGLAKCREVNWSQTLERASWFHLTGITPAIGASASDLALEAVRKAKDMGITVL